MTDIRDISGSVRLLPWDRHAAQPNADIPAEIAGNDGRSNDMLTPKGTWSSSDLGLPLSQAGGSFLTGAFIDVELVAYPTIGALGRSLLNAYRTLQETVTGLLVDTYV